MVLKAELVVMGLVQVRQNRGQFSSIKTRMSVLGTGLRRECSGGEHSEIEGEVANGIEEGKGRKVRDAGEGEVLTAALVELLGRGEEVVQVLHVPISEDRVEFLLKD